MRPRCTLVFVALALLTPARLHAEDPVEALLGPLLRGEHPAALEITALAGERTKARLVLRIDGPEDVTLDLDADFASLRMRRSAAELVFDLRHAGKRLVARGPLPPELADLAPSGFAGRLLGQKEPLLGALFSYLRLRVAAASRDDDAEFGVTQLPEGGITLRHRGRGGFGEGIDVLRLRPPVQEAPPAFTPESTVEVPRTEFESSLFRALRRFTRIYVPPLRESTSVRERRVAHGALLDHEGQRLVILSGTPEELGQAHGELLGDLLQRTLDSYVHLVGAVETLRTGKYFLDELREAWRRLSPHVPHRHVREMNALAAAAGVDAEELRLANVLPEYFHCSGFAVFGKATRDGTLYHGRVLDYMTAIGLQDAAVTFYVEPSEGHAFAHVGYAGFVGVVTGLNAQKLALGEMGGAGRYAWDGVPMATLMRRTLEECRDLGELRALWTSVPRTCEYYYVASWSDGTRHDALGIAATPKQIEFLRPGADHPQLGAGIEDCVLLSAGGRLRELRRRIEEAHGRIDTEAALRLMDRPVAMRSNLHNALMLPARGELHVAHARGDAPAASQPYVRLALSDMARAAKGLAGTQGRRIVRIDEAAPGDFVVHPEERGLLARSSWTPRSFSAELEEGEGRAPRVLRFPSPKPLGIAQNDRVVLEWYPARGDAAKAAPALLALHILDGRMIVARGIARTAALRGIHGFVLHMPGYGERGRDARRAMELFEARTWQCVADLRRARLLIAGLPGIDRQRIWLQGTSLGGMIAALAAAAEPAFAGHFLMLAGGDVPAMLEHGRFDSRKVRAAFERSGITGEELERVLGAVDPVRVARFVEAGETWMFNARDDRVVPAANATRLAQALQLAPERHTWFAGGHYTAAIFLPAVMTRMWSCIESHAPKAR